MHRVSDEILSTHLEVAIATAAPSLLEGLADADRLRRHVAIGDISRHLVERLRCFDILSDAPPGRREDQPELFAVDLAPLG